MGLTRKKVFLCAVILLLPTVYVQYWYMTSVTPQLPQENIRQTLAEEISQSNCTMEIPHINKAKHDNCSTIHVAMVVTGLVESRYLYFTVKSVLMHRSSPLHFHFITDDRAETVLRSMLSSWLVPGISHDYYDLDQATGATDSLTHCSKVLHLYMNLHLILPESVHRVVVLEPTSVVKTDIAELWSETNHSVALCREDCVTHCHNVTALQYTQLGVLNLNLRRLPDNSVSTKNCAQINICAGSLHMNDQASDACQLVQEYDGNLLRYREVKECNTTLKPLVEKVPPQEEFCSLFSWERVTRRRELPFLLGHSYKSSDAFDVTLVNHLDYNRLHLLERSFTNWDGPASIAIQVTESQVQGVMEFLLNSEILRDRRNVSYHLLFKIGPSYAINPLRALGHKFVSTPYVFYSDVDYVSSHGMYTAMKENLRGIKNMTKTAIVIPAFETTKTDFKVPENREDMIQLYSDQTICQVHVKSFYPGQGPTKYKKWVNATEPYYYAEWKDMYEPYCLLHTSIFSFDARFVARFHDKGSHNAELHMAGFKFLVLHDCYIIHLPHKANNQNMDQLQKCSKNWYRDWVKEKRKQYNYYKKDVPNYFIA